VERTKKVVLGPLFTVGAVLAGVGAIKRSLPLVAAGAVAILADQRLPVAQRLKERLQKSTPEA
jgi:hypothetical protein